MPGGPERDRRPGNGLGRVAGTATPPDREAAERGDPREAAAVVPAGLVAAPRAGREALAAAAAAPRQHFRLEAPGATDRTDRHFSWIYRHLGPSEKYFCEACKFPSPTGSFQSKGF